MINEINDINKKYIFFIREGGKQESERTNIKMLLDLKKKLEIEINFYDRMSIESKQIWSTSFEQREKLEREIENIEKFLEENKNDNMVMRGLHDACMNLKFAKSKLHDAHNQSIGSSKVLLFASEKSDHYKKLLSSVQVILNQN